MWGEYKNANSWFKLKKKYKKSKKADVIVRQDKNDFRIKTVTLVGFEIRVSLNLMLNELGSKCKNKMTFTLTLYKWFHFKPIIKEIAEKKRIVHSKLSEKCNEILIT